MTERDKMLVSSESMLRNLLTAAQRHESALALTLDIGNELAKWNAASRLCEALRLALVVVDELCVHDPILSSVALAAFREETRGMRDLLRLASTEIRPERDRVLRDSLPRTARMVRSTVPSLSRSTPAGSIYPRHGSLASMSHDPASSPTCVARRLSTRCSNQPISHTATSAAHAGSARSSSDRFSVTARSRMPASIAHSSSTVICGASISPSASTPSRRPPTLASFAAIFETPIGMGAIHRVSR